jgi:hypothetical protein
MARKLYYKVIDDGTSTIRESEWEAILRLQHWYNSEFIWTAGRLGFKMYAVFPNPEAEEGNRNGLLVRITLRRNELRNQGMTENQAIEQMQSEGLVVVQKGGYIDQCLASGFTRVAANEFDAFLVCEFLLKASALAPDASMVAYDEGEFIKSKRVTFRNRTVTLEIRDEERDRYFRNLVEHRHVFAVVDSAKYDHFPRFQSMVTGFNDKTVDEKLSILKDWNWLGFENNFDLNGDDVQGYDLNKKVSDFLIESAPR